MGFFGFRKKRRSRRRSASGTKHYELYKERARELVHARIAYWNQFYRFSFGRIAIRNQRSRWGSCSTKQNLNFNYKLLFLPIEIVDYVIVHELCHLKHFNHGSEFWLAVGENIPDWKNRKEKLHHISKDIQRYMSEGEHITVKTIFSTPQTIAV